MSTQSQPLQEPFSTHPNEAKLGHDNQQIALELQQNLDLVISLNQNSMAGSIDDELQFATVVENSYRLIHEYATSANIPGVMSRATAKGDDSLVVEEHGDERITLVGVIQSWILDGKNPFNELGIIDARELIENSSDRAPAELELTDIKRFQDAMELSAQDYANSSKVGYEELEDSVIARGDAPGFFNAVDNSGDSQNDRNDRSPKHYLRGKFRKFGRAMSGFFNLGDEASQVTPSRNEQGVSRSNSKIIAIGVVAVMGVGALFMGARNLGSEPTEKTVTPTSTTTYEVAPTTVATTFAENTKSESFIQGLTMNDRSETTSDTSPIETASVAKSVEDIPTSISIPSGSNLWDELQVTLTGRSDSEVDKNPIIEKVISDALSPIAEHNNVSIEQLGQIRSGQQIMLNEAVQRALATAKQN